MIGFSDRQIEILKIIFSFITMDSNGWCKKTSCNGDCVTAKLNSAGFSNAFVQRDDTGIYNSIIYIDEHNVIKLYKYTYRLSIEFYCDGELTNEVTKMSNNTIFIIMVVMKKIKLNWNLYKI